MFSASPLPPLLPGARPGRIRCGARDLCDYRSWDRLGLLADERAKRSLVEGLSGQMLCEFSARASFEAGSLKTAFENRVSGLLSSQYCLYFASQTQAYLSALAALVAPGSVVVADPFALAPLDDAAALLDLTVLRHPCNSKEDVRCIFKSEGLLSRPGVGSVLWLEHANPISSKSFDWRWLSGVLDSGKRVSIVRDLGADIAELDASPFLGDEALSRSAFLARCDVAFAPLTYLCGLPGCLLGVSADLLQRLLASSHYLTLEHTEMPAIFGLGLETLDRLNAGKESLRQLEAENVVIRDGLLSLGLDVTGSKYSCSVGLGSFAQAVGLRDALIERGHLLAAFKVRVPFGENGVLRILPSVFHVEHEVSSLLSAVSEIKKIDPALFYSNFK